ncbi:MAG: hypothetical protein P1U62_14525 [Alteraurantiacibacter sp. bin_em_oilr2.035]|nr:hypothetical protein [Alteraurantiacibacter sp. bin_em_oilr2.035]
MNMRLNLDPRPLFLALAALSLSACAGGNDEPAIFLTPEPELDYGQGYVGKLLINDDCVLLLVGDGLLAQSLSDVDKNQRVVPLFRPGFALEDHEGGFVLISPEGDRFHTNQIVTGEGGIYPDTPDPRSAPVADVPDVSQCGTVAFQINSMTAGSL